MAAWWVGGTRAWQRHSSAAFITVLEAVCGRAPARAEEQQVDIQTAHPCGGGEIARGVVRKIPDGRTFVLGDGREVRLVEVPALASSPQGSAPSRGRVAAAALDALAGCDEVVLRQGEAGSDRYGRLLAYADLIRDGDQFLLQGELVAEGFARAGDRVVRPCSDDLLSREKSARADKLGLWADPYYEVLNAETPSDVLARQGRFALVEGKVVSVRESGATIYVNFGRRWSEDFSVTVLKRNERNFAAAGLDLQGLAGRLIRVRGVIEPRGANGSPSIEALYPEQIETADGQ